MGETARKNNLGFASLPLILLGVVVILAAGGAFFLGKSFTPTKLNQTTTTKPAPSSQTPADWQMQTNQKFGISFVLPKDWDSVEVSDSLVVAPLEVVEDVRDKIAAGSGFGGGTFLTMQVHILDEDYPPDTFKSTAEQEVTKSDTTVGGNAATEYTTKHLTSLPGIEEGAVIKTYLVEGNGKKYSFTLLDKSKADTLQKILSSIKFIKPQGSELLGKTKAEVKVSKGEPKDAGQNVKTKKEVWVYLDQDNDSTATYVYFLNDKVSKVEADEYNGTLEAISWIK